MAGIILVMNNHHNIYVPINQMPTFFFPPLPWGQACLSFPSLPTTVGSTKAGWSMTPWVIKIQKINILSRVKLKSWAWWHRPLIPSLRRKRQQISVNLWSRWSTKWVYGQSELLYRKTLFQKTNKTKSHSEVPSTSLQDSKTLWNLHLPENHNRFSSRMNIAKGIAQLIEYLHKALNSTSWST